MSTIAKNSLSGPSHINARTARCLQIHLGGCSSPLIFKTTRLPMHHRLIVYCRHYPLPRNSRGIEVRYHLSPYDEGQSWIILALMSGTLYNPTYPCAFFIEEMTGSIQDVRHECRDDYVRTNSPFLTTYPAHSITQAS